MGVNYQNNNRQSSKPGTSINKSQRATCNVVIYRYDDLSITKLRQLNAANDKSLSGSETNSTSGNFHTRNRIVIRNDVTRCNITKSKGSSSGTFSINIKRGKQVKDGNVQKEDVNYLNAINSGDWIMIYIKKSGEVNVDSIKPDSGFKFLGIIENVRYVEVDDPDRGSPRLEYLITGRDFGKVLEMDLFFNPIVNPETASTFLGVKFLSDSSKSIKSVAGFNPGEVIKRLVKFYLGGIYDSSSAVNETWYVPAELAKRFKSSFRSKSGGVSFVDLLNLNKIGIQIYSNGKLSGTGALPGAALIKSLPATGNVWGVLQHLQNKAVNEMYTELSVDTNGDLQPTLILRQVPFSNKKNQPTNVFTANKNSGGSNVSDSEVPSGQKTYFVDLPRVEVNSSDIKQKNVGKSDFERINHVIVVPKIDSETYDIAYVSGINVPSIQRYGLKTFQTQTSYVLDPSAGGIKNFCTRCVLLIEDWFFLAHRLFNGTVITDGIDGFVELGTNLYVKDVQQLYHIEGYSHTYQVRPGGDILYETEFNVSRGQVFDPSTQKSNFIDATNIIEPTTVVTSVLESSKDRQA